MPQAGKAVVGTSSLIKNALFFWCNTPSIPEELCLWFCPLKSNIYILYLLQRLSAKRKCFLSSLTCEQVAGQAGKMSVLMLSDTDHMNIYRCFLKCKVVFPNLWCVRGGCWRGGGSCTLEEHSLFSCFFIMCQLLCRKFPLCGVPRDGLGATGCFGCHLPSKRQGHASSTIKNL